MSTTDGQPTENVGTEQDASIHSGQPTQAPADNPAVDTTEEKETFAQQAVDASRNLSPSEIPTAAEVPALVGVLLHHAETGEFPAPLHERFPDNVPNPND